MIMRYHWGQAVGHVHSHGLTSDVRENHTGTQQGAEPALTRSTHSSDQGPGDQGPGDARVRPESGDLGLVNELDPSTENAEDAAEKDAIGDVDKLDAENEDPTGSTENKDAVIDEEPVDDVVDDEDSEPGEVEEIDFELELDRDEMYGDVDSDDDVFSYN